MKSHYSFQLNVTTIKKIILNSFLFIGIIITPEKTFAAPTIIGVTGNITPDAQVTISGNSFGSKSPAQPWLYDNFESNTANAGDSILNRAPKIGTIRWKYYDFGGDGQGSALSYNSTQAYDGVFSAYQADNGSAEQDIYIDGQKTKIRYVSYRFRRSGYSGGVWKLDRTTGGTTNNPPYDSAPNFGYGNTAGTYYNNCSAFYEFAGDMFLPSADQWHRMETYLVASTDPSVGRIVLWEDYSKQTDLAVSTCSSSCGTCGWDTWMSPLIANHSGNIIHTWIDDVYIDNTLARVEVCNTPSWGSRTDCEIQIPVTWTDSSITVSSKVGKFIDGSSAYVYIVDAAGNANATGFPVQIRISTGNIPLAAPTGLHISN